MKKLIFALLCLLPLEGYSLVQEFSAEHIRKCLLHEDTEKKLIDATHRYLDFIKKIGSGESFPHPEVAATLLSPNCKKVFNGTLYTSNRNDFIEDLLLVHKTQGSWSVLPVDVMIDPTNRCSVLRLIIKMEKSETFTAMVILRYDDSYLITEINEVFSRVGNSYDFEGENK